MRLKVTREFQDKYTNELYEVGSEIEIEDTARVADIVSRGLANVEEGPDGRTEK